MHYITGERPHKGQIILPKRRTSQLRLDDAAVIDVYPGFESVADRVEYRPPSRRPWKGTIVWLWIAMAIAAIALALVALRGPIVDLIPTAAGAYRAVGIPTGADGLQIADTRVVRVYSRDWMSLRIEGGLGNPTGRQVTVPPLHLHLLDRNGEILRSLDLTPFPSTVNPGGTARFATDIAAPPAAMDAIALQLGDGPLRPVGID